MLFRSSVMGGRRELVKEYLSIEWWWMIGGLSGKMLMNVEEERGEGIILGMSLKEFLGGV